MRDTHRKRTLARLIGPAAVAALSIGLLPGVAGAVARESDSACAGAPEDGFTDTGADGSAQEEAIDCIAAYGVTRGTTETTFSPGDIVNREQMAAFVYRKLLLVEGLNPPLPSPSSVPDAFPDDDTSEHEDAIDVLAEVDVIDGYTDGTFRPGTFLTRAQTTKFVAGEMEYAGVVLPATPPDAFTDDDIDVHELTINQLAELGIVQGRSASIYQPGSGLTRGQMALILARNLAQLVDDGVLDIAAPAVASDTADDGDATFSLVFDEPVDEASAEDVASYSVSNGGTEVGILTAVRALDPTTVDLVLDAGATLDCSGGAVTLTQTVEDSAGNAAAQVGYVLVPDCTPAGDTTAPMVATDTADDTDTTFTVVFDEAVDAGSAADVANYTVRNGGTEVGIATATRGLDLGTVELVLDAGQALDCSTGAVTLTQTVEDIAGNPGSQVGYVLVADCTDVGDITAPAVESESADDGDFAFRLTFDEPVDQASAEDVTNYLVRNGAVLVPVVSATFDPDANGATNEVLLDLGENIGELDCGTGDVTLDQTVEDTSGNAAAETGYLLVADCTVGGDTAPPTVTSDTADPNDFAFRLTFDEPVDEASAEDISNFVVRNNAVPVPVVTAMRDPDGDGSTNVVRLALADGATVDCTTGDVTLDQTVEDTSGNTAAQIGYVLVPICTVP